MSGLKKRSRCQLEIMKIGEQQALKGMQTLIIYSFWRLCMQARVSPYAPAICSEPRVEHRAG